MMLTTQTKVLILFLSDANPMWNIVLVPPITVGKIAAYMDIAIGTIELWKIGKDINESTIDRAFKRIETLIDTPLDMLYSKRASRSKKTDKDKKPVVSICKPLDEEKKRDAMRICNYFKLSIKSTFRSSIYNLSAVDTHDNSDKIAPKLYHVGSLVGMGMKQCQKIIDEIIYERFSILPNICYLSIDDADAALKRFFGTYDVWIKRRDLWLQARLRVRYVINIKSRKAVRCKMNFPVLRAEPYQIEYFEYDGFLRVHDGKVFWIFEKRELEGTDFFYFITCRGFVHERAGFIMVGKYLTTDQDKHTSITANNLFLQIVPSADENTEEDMHNLNKIRAVNEPTEISDIDQRFEELYTASVCS